MIIGDAMTNKELKDELLKAREELQRKRNILNDKIYDALGEIDYYEYILNTIAIGTMDVQLATIEDFRPEEKRKNETR